MCRLLPIVRATARFAVLAAFLAGGDAARADPPPFPDFSAKRVKPPKPGVSNRITVQIAPRDAPSPSPGDAAPAETAAVAPRAARHGWFWSEIPADLSASGPGRLQDALRVLAAQPGGVAAPRLQTLQDVVRAHGTQILLATIDARVSPALVLAVIAVESGGRSDAVSSAGARGLMQLMPDTAARFDVTDSLDPAQNIRGGTTYLGWLLDRFDGDPVLALAGYNAGENAVAQHEGVPPYAETRDYVPKVLAAYAVARGLCKTPPELITDGCVFAVK